MNMIKIKKTKIFKSIMLLMFMMVVFQSCTLSIKRTSDIPVYKYTSKIYYLDGSIDTVIIKATEEPFISYSIRSGYRLIVYDIDGTYSNPGIDRIDILKKNKLKKY